MTVREFKNKLSEFDDDLQIGGSGHFGEILEVEDIYLKEGFQNVIDNKRRTWVCISIEYAGDEPD